MQDLQFLRFEAGGSDGVFDKYAPSVYSALQKRFESSRFYVDVEKVSGGSCSAILDELFTPRTQLNAILFCVNDKTRMAAEFRIGSELIKVCCNDRHRNDSLIVISRIKIEMPEVWRQLFEPKLKLRQVVA